MTDYQRELDFAREIMAEAGRIALEGQAGVRELRKGDDSPVTAGDHAVDELVLARIADAFPGDGLLSEESEDDPGRLQARRVWILDPVDGTREYGEGRSDWAVHVALAIDGVPTVGAVALPGLDGGILLATDRAGPLPEAAARPRLAVSRTRPAAEALTVAEQLGAELVPMGSAGAKAMAVVRGEVDIYLHSGGQYEWDSAAPAAVALAHGLHASRIDGAPLVYNQRDVAMPDLLICRKDMADSLLAACRNSHIGGKDA